MHNPRKLKRIVLFALVVLSASGCASIKTKQLHRAADGKFTPTCSSPSTRGVPCKFKVETGVRAVITETLFIDPATGQTLAPSTRIYEVSTEKVYSDQVFMVHIPRPLAGTLDLTGNDGGYTFNSDGYLTKIGGSIEDKTIEDITDILGSNSLGGFLKKTSAADVGGTKLQEIKRTIAMREFSLASPTWHLELNDWLTQFQACHITCNQGCQAEVNGNPSVLSQ